MLNDRSQSVGMTVALAIGCAVFCSTGHTADEKPASKEDAQANKEAAYWIKKSKQYLEQFKHGPALDDEEYLYMRAERLADIAIVQGISGDHTAMESSIKLIRQIASNLEEPDMASIVRSFVADARAYAGQFTKAEAEAEDRYYTMIMIVEGMMQRGRRDDALKILKKIIEELSGNEEMQTYIESIIGAQLRLDDQAGALQSIKEHVKDDMVKTGAYLEFAMYLATFRSPAEAAPWLERARKLLALIETKPIEEEYFQEDRDYLRSNVAVLQTMLGDDAGARKTMKTLTAPNLQSHALANMALEQWVLGKDAKAKLNLNQAMKQAANVEFIDNRAGNWFMIGFASGYGGQTKDAAKWVKGIGHPLMRSAASCGIAHGLLQRRMDEKMKKSIRSKTNK